MYSSYIRDAVLRSVGKNCKVLQDASQDVNGWNRRSSLGEDYKTIPRPREFLWQEGHTIHATYEEAEERTIQMWHVYEDFYKETMAIPYVSGRKARA